MRIGGLAEGRVGRQSEGSTGDATTDESRELAAGEPGRRSEGKDGRATLDASWESAAGRAGRSDDRLDCDAVKTLVVGARSSDTGTVTSRLCRKARPWDRDGGRRSKVPQTCLRFRPGDLQRLPFILLLRLGFGGSFSGLWYHLP